LNYFSLNKWIFKSEINYLSRGRTNKKMELGLQALKADGLQYKNFIRVILNAGIIVVSL